MADELEQVKKELEEERRLRREETREAEEEKRKAGEEKRKAQEEKRKAEEEKRKAEEREAGLKTRLAKAIESENFYDLKLPQMKRGLGTTEPSENLLHKEASLVISPFLALDPLPEARHGPLLQDFVTKEGNIKFATEADVQKFITIYLQAALSATGLSQQLETFCEYYILRYKPDLLIIFSENHIPCGVVEVKVPGENALEDTRLKGQLYNYLRLLRDVFGVQEVFGIMSTYTEWRFCWLDRTLDTDKRGNDLRCFRGTNVFRYDHKDLHKLVVTALASMAKAKVIKPKITKGSSVLLQVSEETLAWKLLDVDLNEDEFPRRDSSSFFLLELLGSGAEGKVWRACNSGGKLCALKLFNVDKETDVARVNEKIDQEIQLWKDVFGIQRIFRTTLGRGAPALVMPLLEIRESLEKTSPEDRDRVKCAVAEYAKFYRARDLKWAHVGFLKGATTVLLFDTRPVLATSIEEGKGEREMLEQLGLV